MRTLPACLATVLLGASPPVAEGPGCVCPKVRVADGWCGPCRTGYVASVEIRSPLLFEALDAHGHEIDPASLECEGCREAIRKDGFCEKSGYGFVRKELYFSKLTWVLARGERQAPGALRCRACAANARRRPGAEPAPPEAGTRGGDGAEHGDANPAADPDRDETPGWCRECGVGMAGNVAFRDLEHFEIARREMARLVRAIEASRRCETCAVALFYDRRCPKCRIGYRDGRPVSRPASGPPPGS